MCWRSRASLSKARMREQAVRFSERSFVKPDCQVWMGWVFADAWSCVVGLGVGRGGHGVGFDVYFVAGLE